MSAENGASGHVFISYVRENSSEVDDLQRILESHGIRVWRDKSSLWPGDDWQVAIRAAITDDALVFIACFSRESVAKRQSYQHEELNLAVEEMRRRPSGQPWLIPARLNECEIPDINLGGGRTLRSLHWADLFGADAGANADRLVSAVRRILGKHSTQAGLPEAVLHQPVSPPGAATPPQEAPPLAQHVPNGSASANWPVRKRVKRRSTLAAVCLIVFAAAVVLVVRTFFGGENAGPGGDWALTTLQGTGRLSSDSGASVAFSPAGTTLATDSGNDAAYLRNLSNLKIIAPLRIPGAMASARWRSVQAARPWP